MKTFEELVAELKKALSGPLPGFEAQMKMAGMRRKIDHANVIVPDDARKGGVLILFYPVQRSINLVFIKRNTYPGVHSGQISFPGGAWEAGDKNLIETALREAREEIGIQHKEVTILGELTDLYIPPSNFLVTPVAAYTMKHPEFTPDPAEVDRILEIPVASLSEPGNKQIREITVFPDMKWKVPCYYVDNEVIWGATAMMLSELLELITP